MMRETQTNNFAKLDAEDFPQFHAGWVWLVGAGPGAPGLMSLLAYHALQNCDIVVYDALVNPDMLRWLPKGVETEYAGKRGGKPSPVQKDISLRLIELAKQGKRVLRLKGGDPFMFGRGGEESQTLAKAGIPFRIVPGITAGVGGLAYAGIPATHRDTNHAVIFLTGHDATGKMPANVNWQAIATAAPVIVMYMGVKNLGEIATALIAAGRPADHPVTIVSNASLPAQTVASTILSQAGAFVEAHKPPTPAIVVIGHASDWRPLLDWYSPELMENKIG
jgi:uroporphyrin-III C-methyltransferase